MDIKSSYSETNNEVEKLNKYISFFKPAKYLVPAAIMALVVTGCDPDAPGDISDTVNTGDGTVNPNTVIDAPSFNAPVALNVSWLSSGGNYSIFQPSLADMDDDGDLDLIVGYKAATAAYLGREMIYSPGSYNEQGIVYLKNDSAAGAALHFTQDVETFSGFPHNYFGYSSSAVGPMLVSAGDIDGDGDVDIAAASNYSRNGGGAFKGAKLYSAKNNSGSFAEAPYSSMGFYSSSAQYSAHMAPALADLDGDVDLDLTKGNTYLYYAWSSPNPFSLNGKQVYYIPNQDGTGNFFNEAPSEDIVALSPITGVSQLPIPSFVDIDDDGDMDMFTVMYDTGAVTFYLNEGTPTAPVFTAQASAFSVLPDDGVKYFPAFGDVDGDGDMDLIAGTDDGQLLFVENTDIE